MNGPAFNEFINNDVNNNQESNHVHVNRQDIYIPPHLNGVFDKVAVTLLSRGNESLAKLVYYLQTYKKVHWGNPYETTFMHIALLAGGHIKHILNAMGVFNKLPHLKGFTEKPNIRN